MREAYLDADPVAFWHDAPARHKNVHESWLAKTPLPRHKAVVISLLPPRWRHLVPPRDAVGLAMVSSHSFAHRVDVRATAEMGGPKYAYVHTPVRYIWEPQLDARGNSVVPRTASMFLRPLDRKRAEKPVVIAANSKFTNERVRRTCHRDDSTAIYPPVEVVKIRAVPDWRECLEGADVDFAGHLPDGFIPGAARFVSYKRLANVIRVGARLGQLVVIAGFGAEDRHLRALAAEPDANVRLVLKPSDELLYSLHQTCAAYVFPAIEVFGIMTVEAMAAGAQVVVGAPGSAAESVRLTDERVVVQSDRINALAEATMQQAMGEAPTKSHRVERLYGKQRFNEQIRSWVRP